MPQEAPVMRAVPFDDELLMFLSSRVNLKLVALHLDCDYNPYQALDTCDGDLVIDFLRGRQCAIPEPKRQKHMSASWRSRRRNFAKRGSRGLESRSFLRMPGPP